MLLCIFAGGKALQRCHLACLQVADVLFISRPAVTTQLATAALGTGPSQTGAAVVAANTQNRVP